ncbi:GAP family protein [Arthrobacter sp. H35-D1]|uniref:GAP family protein n=1 Tax=Arthrobacter sp. H35-D1 TaxID=3046202 RepID=UPI0024BA77A4|nr:GAP family protein [Arthrobacter sp. H35-D1]MDJ0312471.1 GAP family protein [Arthrobacter sp. H35-D1]
MTIVIYVQLTVLALIDSTSIGTLLIPLWLLMRPDAKRLAPRILLFLGVLAGFYLLLGAAVLSGAGWALGGLGAGSLTRIPAIQWGMAIGGGAMLAYALLADLGKKRSKQAAVAAAPAAGAGSTSGHPDAPAPDTARATAPAAATAPAPAPGEQRWQARLGTALRSPGGIVVLALLAGLLELPTMLPYLAAIGFLTSSTLPVSAQLLVLCVYCLVMLIPALVLLVLRLVLGERLDAVLQRLGAKVGKFSAGTLPWVVGILGFLLLRSGLSLLAPMAPWNPSK